MLQNICIYCVLFELQQVDSTAMKFMKSVLTVANDIPPMMTNIHLIRKFALIVVYLITLINIRLQAR